MQAEIMTLYRERGVNPASGCVPMLLTMPVLIAFYSLLSVAIEIRGAPFVGWLKDLSVHDPLYVTPLLMGGTMVWQQVITPMAGDPTQQRMMLVIMPVMFTVMLLWAPSGLVLYWLVSNLWSIGQQYVTNRIIGPATVRTVRPPAERRLKRGGNKPTE
jgi:YidC/Oxa1 family membrane protein insertase